MLRARNVYWQPGRAHPPRRPDAWDTRRWASKQWIICVLSFKGRQRQVMGPGYTELFFLDEVTALAAGHRPCFECQRAKALAYAHAFPGEGRTPAPVMDRRLHAERLGPRPKGRAGDLPDGAMVEMDGTAWAKRGARLLRWTPRGYDATAPLPRARVEILTPDATRAALTAGYVPNWHDSAKAV